MLTFSMTALKAVVLVLSWLVVRATINSTAVHRFSSLGDVVGPDRELMQSLHALIDFRGPFHCKTTARRIQSLRKLDSTYVGGVVSKALLHGKAGIVSPPRKRCTAWLTKAALTLPEGDIVETGTYIGTSAAIILQILQDFDTCERKLWVFDSFEGLPALTMEDKGQGSMGDFKANETTLMENLIDAGVYDEQRLVITKGWFSTTCKESKVERISFLRLDGDLFSSTWDAITTLYDRVVVGGFIYVDDYGSFVGCRTAVDKFRYEHNITDPLHYVRENEPRSRKILFEAVWWRKTR